MDAEMPILHTHVCTKTFCACIEGVFVLWNLKSMEYSFLVNCPSLARSRSRARALSLSTILHLATSDQDLTASSTRA